MSVICLLKFSVRTENVNDFVLDGLLDLFASDFEIFSRVESAGICVHDAADTCRKGETDIRVNVDFADRH